LRTKHTFRLPPDLAGQLADYANRKRVPQALVVETALSSYLSPDNSERMEAALGRRLDRLTRQVERLERHVTISNEALALFVRFWLTVTPPLPDTAQPAAQAKGGNATKPTSKRWAGGWQRGRAWRRRSPRTSIQARATRTSRPARLKACLRRRQFFYASTRCSKRACCSLACSASSHRPHRDDTRLRRARDSILAIRKLNSEAASRGARMLRTARGPSIARWLEDPKVLEVLLNPDGRLWLDRLADGLVDTGERLSPGDGERVVRLIAHHVGAEVHSGSPRVSAELPESGERFEGLLPPVVVAPTFAIRKPAVAVFALDDYVAAGMMTVCQTAILRTAVAERANILVAGGTSTGKTTLTNALLAEVAKTADRVVLIEDTRELQCEAKNLVALWTRDGVASLCDLVRSSLRLRPDRIPIGEVRGAEAPDLLKAWGTGHPGGIGTIHAGSTLGALRRMEQQEAVVTVPRALIAETIQVIAVLTGRGPTGASPNWHRCEDLVLTTAIFSTSWETGDDARALGRPQLDYAGRRDRCPVVGQQSGTSSRFEHALGATA